MIADTSYPQYPRAEARRITSSAVQEFQAITFSSTATDSSSSMVNNKHVKLAKIKLIGSNLTMRELHHLSSVLEAHKVGVASLEISLSNFSTKMAFFLAGNLNKYSLSTLRLVHVGLRDADCAALATGIRESSVKRLDLCFNNLGECGAKALANAVRGERGLESLFLGRNHVGPGGAAVLASVLADSSLTSLDLRMNGIGDAGVCSLADALPCSRLVSLQLDSNHICTGGVHALAAALPHASSLRSLSLGKNDLDDISVSPLWKILAKTTVTKLGLDGNGLTDVGVACLAAAVRAAPNMKVLDLRNNRRVTDQGAEALFAAVMTHQTMSKVLLQGTSVSGAMSEKLDSKLNALHSERARTMTVLCSVRLNDRIGTRAGTLNQLPVELLRILADML